MQVICNRSHLFIEPAAPKKPARKVNIPASPSPQNAPDWLRDLPAFKRAVRAKVIREVFFAPEPEPEPEVEEKAAPEVPETPKGKSKAAK